MSTKIASIELKSTDYMKIIKKHTIKVTDIIKIINDKSIGINSVLIEKALVQSCDNIYSKKTLEQTIQSIIYAKKNKRNKVSNSSVCPLSFNIDRDYSYENIIINNYSVQQLKSFCRKYRQLRGGTKDELQNRMFFYLLRSVDAIIIQKTWRNHIMKKYHMMRGPARFKRDICINETDFCTMEDIKGISYEQFFSYMDIDDKIYGFDLISIFTLLSKGRFLTQNPYNRNKIPNIVRKNINTILRLASLMKENIIVHIEEPEELNPQKKLEQRTHNIFHEMDLLGNYTQMEWFTSLGRAALIRFIRELADIWNYRANLSEMTKMEICPPNGNPFAPNGYNSGNILHSLLTLQTDMLKSQALTIIEKIVKSGVNHGSQCLGTNYVLCAFTLVNSNARESLPWLYQSVM